MSLFKSKDEKMAEQLQESILKELTRTKNLVEDFAVECSDGVATLSGICDTPKTRKKAILFAEMAEGVTDVQSGGLRISESSAEAQAEIEPPADAPAEIGGAAVSEVSKEAGGAAKSSPVGADEAPAQAEPETRAMQPEESAPESQVYTIQSGDSLSKIAKKFYGNANTYMVIFEANRDILTDPDKIYPGQEIRIPPLE